MAKTIDPFALIARQPGGQQLGFPRRRRRLESLELVEHRHQARLAPELGAGRDVLPGQQEAHEVLRGHGLGSTAASPARVRVHSGEQPPGDPLDLARRFTKRLPRPLRAWVVVALEGEAGLFEHGKTGGDARLGQGGGHRERARRGDAHRLEVAPQHQRDCRLITGEGLERDIVALDGAPHLDPVALHGAYAPARRELVPALAPLSTRSRHHQ